MVRIKQVAEDTRTHKIFTVGDNVHLILDKYSSIVLENRPYTVTDISEDSIFLEDSITVPISSIETFIVSAKYWR